MVYLALFRIGLSALHHIKCAIEIGGTSANVLSNLEEIFCEQYLILGNIPLILGKTNMLGNITTTIGNITRIRILAGINFRGLLTYVNWGFFFGKLLQ